MLALAALVLGGPHHVLEEASPAGGPAWSAAAHHLSPGHSGADLGCAEHCAAHMPGAPPPTPSIAPPVAVAIPWPTTTAAPRPGLADRPPAPPPRA